MQILDLLHGNSENYTQVMGLKILTHIMEGNFLLLVFPWLVDKNHVVF